MDFLGNFYMSNTTDVELAAMDSEQSIAVEVKHDDKLSEAEGAFVQVSVTLSTSRFVFCMFLVGDLIVKTSDTSAGTCPLSL